MSRKDYRAIAASFARVPAESKVLVREIAETLAHQLARDNPRFDRARFMAACGLE